LEEPGTGLLLKLTSKYEHLSSVEPAMMKGFTQSVSHTYPPEVSKFAMIAGMVPALTSEVHAVR